MYFYQYSKRLNSFFNRFKENIFFGILFLIISNYLYPFYYGVSDNREELPAIFFINKIALYFNDEYISRSVNEYNVATPYLYSLAFLTKKLDFTSYPIVFFSLHQLTLIGIFFSLKKTTKYFSTKFNYFSFFISIICLELLLLKFPYIIFGGRWLISNYFDPQFLAYFFCFTSIFFFLVGKIYKSSIFLFFANILSPLLVIPIFFGFLFVKFAILIAKKNNKDELINSYFAFTISTVPYTVFLYSKTTSSELLYSHQKIMTEVRSTDLSRIPNLNDITGTDLYFFGFLFLIVFLITIFLIKNYKNLKDLIYHKKYDYDLNFFLFAFFIIIFLGLSSIISSIVTIPLLYRLDPFRISVILIPLIYLFLISRVVNLINLRTIKISTYRFSWLIVMLSGIFLLTENYSNISLKAYGDRNNYNNNSTYLDAKETISWIKKNTQINDTFVNYADSKNFLTIRTHALRSQYFSWKTINLTNSGIVDWYKRLLIFYDVSLNPYDYAGIKKLIGKKGKKIKSVNITNVLGRINYQINYIVIPNNFKLIENNFLKVFKNNSYTIFEVK